MAKGRRTAGPRAVTDQESADIAATRRAIEPLLAAGVSPHRLASACGAHVDDLRGFLEGRVSLTPALRERLRAAVPAIALALDPLRRG